MREIKFRAWDKELKEMIYGDDYIGSEQIACALEVIMHGGCDEWTEQIEIMQYTGLADKHGKEIYEGDICNIGEDGHALPLPVSFCDGGFVVNWNGFHDTPQYSSLSAYCNKVFQNCVEVIGNIYENPELTGGTQKAPDLEGLKNCK